MDPASPSDHDSEKENLPPSPSPARNQDPVPASSKPPKKKTTKTRKRKRVFTTRKRRVVTRKPLADITLVSVEPSSVRRTGAVVESATSAVLVQESGSGLAPSSSPVQEAGVESPPYPPPPPPPSSAPGGASSSRKRKAVDQNDSSPNTKSLRMGFR